MKRRRLLVALGGSLTLAGCLSRGSEPGESAQPTDDTGAPTDTPDPGPTASGTFHVGETTGDANPHGLTVHNEGDTPRSVDLRIVDTDTGETLLDQSYSIGAGEAIGGELRGPDGYEVRVEVTDAGTEHVTTVEYFDTCNDYGTTVTIAPDGSLSSETISTLLECDSVTPTDDPEE